MAGIRRMHYGSIGPLSCALLPRPQRRAPHGIRKAAACPSLPQTQSGKVSLQSLSNLRVNLPAMQAASAAEMLFMPCVYSVSTPDSGSSSSQWNLDHETSKRNSAGPTCHAVSADSIISDAPDTSGMQGWPDGNFDLQTCNDKCGK